MKKTRVKLLPLWSSSMDKVTIKGTPENGCALYFLVCQKAYFSTHWEIQKIICQNILSLILIHISEEGYFLI